MNYNVHALEVQNLDIGYSKNNILMKNINFVIPCGVRCAIVGLNGSGKTTLLNSILGLIPHYNGKIKFFNTSFSKVRNLIAYVPQIKTVDWTFPITVMSVIEMGCYQIEGLKCYLSDKCHEKVHQALVQMNLEEHKDKQINNLSGGQKQRVFIGRALAQQPNLYILDEPLTGLDMVSEKIITDLFSKLSNNGKTIIAVHHDIYTLYEYFNWIIIVCNGILYSGPLNKNIVEPFIEEAFFKPL